MPDDSFVKEEPVGSKAIRVNEFIVYTAGLFYLYSLLLECISLVNDLWKGTSLYCWQPTLIDEYSNFPKFCLKKKKEL